MICIGCGSEYVGDCDACYERLKRCVTVYVHWPMELTLSAAAIAHIESAIRDYLPTIDACHDPVTELSTVANQIRAYLQHVAAGKPHYEHNITDEELLS